MKTLTDAMVTEVLGDIEAVRRSCQTFGVDRLSVFGSALTEQFDPKTSDVDLLVTFLPDRPNVFHDYFDLKEELERVVGRSVDLVVERTVKNPYLKASIFERAIEIYSAHSDGLAPTPPR